MKSRIMRSLALTLAVLLAVPFAAHATVSGAVSVNVQLQDARTSGTEQAQQNINQLLSWTVGHGTGAGLFNRCWPSTRSLNASANEDLDLVGALTNVFGAATFSAVKLIIVSSAAANTTNLTISRPASNGVPFFAAAGDAVLLTPGDFFVQTRRSAAGIAVTADTGDLINVANASGATASYTIIVCGLQP